MPLKNWLNVNLHQYPRLWKISIYIVGFITFDIDSAFLRRKMKVLNSFENSQDMRFEIIFDAQCLQTPSRDRGIGNYALGFIAAFCKKYEDKRFGVVLSTQNGQTQLNKAYSKLKSLDQKNLEIIICDPYGKNSILKSKKIQDRFREFLESYSPAIVICLSAFEKFSYAVPLPKSLIYKRAGIVYDVIPLEFPEEFLISRKQKKSYEWNSRNLNNFELLFAISHKTKKLYSDMVDVNSNLQVIYGGYEDHAFPLSSGENYLRSGVLCVASELHHKNVGRLIEAYALLPLELRKIHPLTIVGIKTSGARRKFLNLARNNECKIRVPNYVTKLELRQLYNQSRLLVVPSLSEGLSLPILEAWTEGLVVVGSSGTTIEEVLLWDQLLFNPEDSLSMAKVIQKFLDSNQLWLEAQKKSQERLQEFSWASTILLAENELRRLVNEA